MLTWVAANVSLVAALGVWFFTSVGWLVTRWEGQRKERQVRIPPIVIARIGAS
jgi:hypothetical protein